MLALAINACARPDSTPELEEVELWGFRSLITAPGTATVPELDREAPPRLRHRGPPREGLRARLTVGGVAAELPAKPPRVVGDRVSVEFDPPEAVVPEGRGRLDVGGWSREVVWSRPPSDEPALADARALRDAGRWAEADQAYAAAARALPLERRWIAAFERAGTAGRRGDTTAAAALYLVASASAAAALRPTQVTRGWRAAAYSYYLGRQFDRVEPLLARAEAEDRRLGNPSGIARAAHYRGLTLEARGQYRRATEALESGLAIASAYGIADDEALLLKSLGPILQDAGLHARALETLDRAAPYYAHARDRERLHYLADRGWVLTRAMVSGVLPVAWDEPERYMREALMLARGQRDTIEEANLLTNLLWVGQLRRAPDLAARLAELEATHTPRDSFPRLFAEGVQAELLLEAGQVDAADAAFTALAARADEDAPGLPSEARARAYRGLAASAQRRGRAAAASGWYARALDEVERLAVEVDVRDARARYWLDREAIGDEALALELARGRPDLAFAVSERERALVLRTLERPLLVERLSVDERAEWTERRARYAALVERHAEAREQERLSPDDALAGRTEARQRARRELAAAFTAAYGYLDERAARLAGEPPEPRRLARALGASERLWSRVRTPAGLLHFSIGPGGLESAGRHVPAGLAAARRVYVLPEPDADLAEIVRTEVDGAPLIERASVSFLTHAAQLLRPRAHARRPAVVVADPDGTLPEARGEGRWVLARNTGAIGLIGAAATRAALNAALDGAALFHFSGHSGLEASSPWDTYLGLADGERLSLEDLLVMRPRVPLVVLSGCESGALAPLSHRHAIGLAQAFLAAGADAVLATAGRVDDGEARQFIERFYEAGGAVRPLEAYRAAVLDAMAHDTPAARAFFVWGRADD